MNMMIRPVSDLKPVATEWVRPRRGYERAPVLVVCDAQNQNALKQQLPMDKDDLKWLAGELEGTGLERTDFMFVALCPPIAKQDLASDARQWKHVEPHTETINDIIDAHKPKLVVTLGALASRVVMGRAVKITKARGVPTVRAGKPPVMPMFSPWYVRKKPENKNVFEADLATIARLKHNGFDPNQMIAVETDYRWVESLDELIAAKPQVVAYDTETTGLVWWKPETRVLVAQFTDRPGRTFLAPVHPVYFAKVFPGRPPEVLEMLRAQVKEVLENPFIRKIGHNIKFDHQVSLKEDWEVKGWLHDTALMAFFADENILEKSLDECTRLFVPELASYADQFNKTTDKSRMIDVPPEDVLDLAGNIVTHGMRRYAGGDTDACFRLAQRLDRIIRKDERQYKCYRKVQWPALLAFAKVVERYGILIDQDNLRTLGMEVADFVQETGNDLIRLVPAGLRREYLKRNEEMELTRPKVIREILFGKKGFGLKAKVWTASTAALPMAQREPSTSIKDHLPYFKMEEGPAGEFVRKFIDWVQSQKMLTTYLGNSQEGTGFWQYIAPDGAVFPSYQLHKVVTGRTSSEYPNGQNFPKRGRFAKAYNKVFKARPGHKLISADLSQIELRLAAWMAGEKTMIEIYRSGGDIHMATAEATAGVQEGFYARHKKDSRILVENGVANDFSGSGDFLSRLNPGARRTATVADFIKQQRFKAKACIAEGQLVLTSNGLKPIENVSTKDLVWDGVEWVEHEGVIYQGYREVIEYDGVLATPDHAVLDRNGRKVQIGQLASEVDGPGIAVGATEETPVGFSYDHGLGDYYGPLPHGGNHLSDLWRGSSLACGQSSVWQNHGLPLPAGGQEPLHATQRGVRPEAREDRRPLRCDQAALHQPEVSGFPGLRCEGDRASLYVPDSVHRVCDEGASARELRGCADRQGEQRGPLRAGKSAAGYAAGEPDEHAARAQDHIQGGEHQLVSADRTYQIGSSDLFLQSQLDYEDVLSRTDGGANSGKRFAKVYDIVNAGPRHVFTVNGRLVFNCNFGFLYGMGAESFREYAKTQYDVDYTEAEAEQARTRFFAKYPKLEPWHKAMREFVRKHGFVRALHGAIRHLPSIYSTERGVQGEAERQAINSPVQRLGSDLGLLALWRFTFQADPDKFRILGFIHDALVMEVKDGYELEGIKALLYAMEHVPLKEYFNLEPPLPIKAEADIGVSFGEMFELGDLPKPEKQPDWLKAMNVEELAAAAAEKPVWWSDDWKAVEHQFHVRQTLSAF